MGQNHQTVPNMNKKNKLVPSLPGGFQDSWGSDLILKKKLLKIIEKNFIKFGFSPLETSPMEYSTLIGNSLAEDEDNPMADVYAFKDDGIDISLIRTDGLNYFKPLESISISFDSFLKKNKESIQCIVSNLPVEGKIDFGFAQKPSISEYADGIDTLAFLNGLN